MIPHENVSEDALPMERDKGDKSAETRRLFRLLEAPRLKETTRRVWIIEGDGDLSLTFSTWPRDGDVLNTLLIKDRSPVRLVFDRLCHRLVRNAALEDHGPVRAVARIQT